MSFIDEHRPVVLLGERGCGKTHLAVALATTAVEAGYRGYFTTADDMERTLLADRAAGNYATKLRAETPDALVIDDVGCSRSVPRARGVLHRHQRQR